jgi:hypothetical protein
MVKKPLPEKIRRDTHISAGYDSQRNVATRHYVSRGFVEY